ncbi:MAG: hypothetical protein ACI8PV_000333 [Dinoroseobacter sp.]|jgi:hypothetical protein
MNFNRQSPSCSRYRIPMFLGLALLSACSLGVNHAAEAPKSADASKIEKQQTKQISGVKNMPKRFSRDELISTAKQDLAKDLDLDLKEIKVLSASPVTWRSGALGCPKPGEVYTQALVPGVLIVLGAQSKHYRYHGKRHGLASLCPNPRAESPAPSSNDI